jgi:hypothetical protein
MATNRPRRRRALALALALPLALGALAACGGDDDDSSASETGGAGTTTVGEITGDGGTTEVVESGDTVEELPVIAGETNEVDITESGGARTITSNSIPNHAVGEFPNAGNPNSISPQDLSWSMTTSPEAASSPTELELGVYAQFAVAVNGVAFEPEAAEWWNRDRNSGWQYEALGGGIDLGADENNAHVQPDGQYHYHGMPTGLLEVLGADGQEMALVGYAGDGFPVYARWGHEHAEDASSEVVSVTPSWRLKSGTRPDGPGGTYDGTFTEDYEFVSGSGDLDECNGREGVTPEYPDGIYHYFITEDFPYVPRCWVGTPDETFEESGGGATAGGPRP